MSDILEERVRIRADLRFQEINRLRAQAIEDQDGPTYVRLCHEMGIPGGSIEDHQLYERGGGDTSYLDD